MFRNSTPSKQKKKRFRALSLTVGKVIKLLLFSFFYAENRGRDSVGMLLLAGASRSIEAWMRTGGAGPNNAVSLLYLHVQRAHTAVCRLEGQTHTHTHTQPTVMADNAPTRTRTRGFSFSTEYFDYPSARPQSTNASRFVCFAQSRTRLAPYIKTDLNLTFETLFYTLPFFSFLSVVFPPSSLK